MKIAILDLGTNTFHLLIANVNRDKSWNKILQERVTVKLGKGGIDKNIITPSAYRRGMDALKKFHDAISMHKIRTVLVYGTAALRSAQNGNDFLIEAKKKFGFRIQLISGSEEAELILLGVRQAVNLTNVPSLIMDIGGGSVEFIISSDSKIFWKSSFKLGAALLQGKFQPGDPLSSNEIRLISSYVSTELKPLLAAIKKFQPSQLIGSAGSFETFASMIRHNHPETGSHYGKTSHNIDIGKFRQLHKKLIVSGREERNKMRGLIKMRIDMIVMASLLLNFVLDHARVQQMKLSSYALKEGALWKEIHKTSFKKIAG